MPTYLQNLSVPQPIRADETTTISRAIESCCKVQCYRPYGRVMGEDALKSGSQWQQSTNQTATLESSKPEEFPPRQPLSLTKPSAPSATSHCIEELVSCRQGPAAVTIYPQMCKLSATSASACREYSIKRPHHLTSAAATSWREVSHGFSDVTPARLEVLQNRITRYGLISALTLNSL